MPWVSANNTSPGTLTRSQAKKLKEFTARNEDPHLIQVRQTPELVERILHFLPDQDLQNACLVSKMFNQESIRACRDNRKEDVKIFQKALSKKLIDHANQVGINPELKNRILNVVSQISSVRLNGFESMKTLKEVDSLCKKLEEKFAAYLGTLEDPILVPTIFEQLTLPSCFKEILPKALDWTQDCLQFKDAIRNNHFNFTSEIIFDLCSKFEDVIPEYKASSKVLEAVLAPPVVNGLPNQHFNYLIANSSSVLLKVTEPEIKKQLFTTVINHHLQNPFNDSYDVRNITSLVRENPEFESKCEELVKTFCKNATSDAFAGYLKSELELSHYNSYHPNSPYKNAKRYGLDALSSFPRCLELIQKLPYDQRNHEYHIAILDVLINEGQGQAWLEATLPLRTCSSSTYFDSTRILEMIQRGAISLLNLDEIEEAFQYIQAYLDHKELHPYFRHSSLDFLQAIFDKTGRDGLKRFFDLLANYPEVLSEHYDHMIELKSTKLDANLLAEICSLIPVNTANRLFMKSFVFHEGLKTRTLGELGNMLKTDGLLPNLAPLAIGGTTTFISKSITLARNTPSFISRVAVSARNRVSAAANWMFRATSDSTSFSENLKRSAEDEDLDVKRKRIDDEEMNATIDNEDSASTAKRPRMFDVD